MIHPDQATGCEAILHSEDVPPGPNTFSLWSYSRLPASYGLREHTIQTASISRFQWCKICPELTTGWEVALHCEHGVMFDYRCPIDLRRTLFELSESVNSNVI